MTPQTPERTNEEIANAEAEKWYTEECFKCPTFFGCFIEGYLRGSKAKDTLYQAEIAKKEATIKKLREALDKISMSIFLTDCQNFAREALALHDKEHGGGE